MKPMKLLLIDGHYYAYRSFFAIQSLSNSKGEPTNAIYGFVKTIRRMIKDLRPDLGAVVWDEGLPTRRTDLQPAYKQQRAEMPDLLRPQLRCIQEELTEMMGFHSISSPDTEADDLMASYTVAARALDHDVVLATNDKDLFQLVNDHVKVYSTNKTDLANPKDTHALLGEEAVLKKWGVAPPQIGDILALIGDSVDNIPGVPGLGPKGATALVTAHGSVEKILANLEAITKDSLREKLAAARDQINQNREMVRLDLDLPLPVAVGDLRITPRHLDLITALQRCEFKSLLEEIRTEAASLSTVQTTQGELF